MLTCQPGWKWVAHLRRAVELEDGLLYDEPWGWMQPTRHALGALLMDAGQFAEAEAVYFFEPDGPDRFLGEWRSGQGVRWFHTDQAGSVRAVTDATPQLATAVLHALDLWILRER